MDTAGRTARRSRLASVFAGLVAGAVVLGVAQLVSVLFAPTSSPLLAVGGAFIDSTPSWLKDAAIAAFGTNDKLALQIGMGIVVAALAAASGVLEARRPPSGSALLGVLSLVAAAAAAARPGGGSLDVVPALVGAGAGIAVMRALVARLDGAAAPGYDGGVDRRSFLTMAAIAAGGAAVVATAGIILGGARRAVDAARDALSLPRAARPAPALPPGTQVPGVGDFVTPNADFYRIDTALTVPRVDPDTWRIRVHGLVEHEVEMTLTELLDEDLVEAWVTLTCVSNSVGGDLAGNARWLGYPVRDLLARARPRAGADMVLSRSADGFTASTPLEVLTDERDALLAVGMNGEPLPLEHGFPVRMVVPGLYGYVSATKWVVDLEVTRFAEAAAYWTVRGWAERAPVKTASRIEVPRGGSTVRAGRVDVGGTAWAQHRGVERVEVRIDEGSWQAADLAAVPGVDTWRQWSFAWDANPGVHLLEVRAWDPEGPQTGERSPAAPDGATGWHSIGVTVQA